MARKDDEQTSLEDTRAPAKDTSPAARPTARDTVLGVDHFLAACPILRQAGRGVDAAFRAYTRSHKMYRMTYAEWEATAQKFLKNPVK